MALQLPRVFECTILRCSADELIARACAITESVHVDVLLCDGDGRGAGDRLRRRDASAPLADVMARVRDRRPCPVEGAPSCYIAQLPLESLEILQDSVILPKEVGELPSAVTRHVWASPTATCTNLHYDYQHNVLAVLRGHKRVLLAPAHAPVPGVGPLWDTGTANHCLDNGIAWDGAQLRRVLPDGFVSTLDICAGQALFLPRGWWHQVSSDAGTIAISHWFDPAPLCSASRAAIGALSDSALAARVSLEALSADWVRHRVTERLGGPIKRARAEDDAAAAAADGLREAVEAALLASDAPRLASVLESEGLAPHDAAWVSILDELSERGPEWLQRLHELLDQAADTDAVGLRRAASRLDEALVAAERPGLVELLARAESELRRSAMRDVVRWLVAGELG